MSYYLIASTLAYIPNLCNQYDTLEEANQAQIMLEREFDCSKLDDAECDYAPSCKKNLYVELLKCKSVFPSHIRAIFVSLPHYEIIEEVAHTTHIQCPTTNQSSTVLQGLGSV